MKKLDRKQMAARVAQDIPEGAYVNLGIGLPTLVADYLPKGREIILHSENGVLGIGPRPAKGEEDEDHVRLYFENGSVVQATAVLACDGVFSAARRQIYPDDGPIFFGQINWASIIETSKLPTDVHPVPNTVGYFEYTGEPRWTAMLNDGGTWSVDHPFLHIFGVFDHHSRWVLDYRDVTHTFDRFGSHVLAISRGRS